MLSAAMEAFTTLEELKLECVPLPLTIFNVISAFPNLRSLAFVTCRLRENITNIPTMPSPSLEKLLIMGMRYSDVVIRSLMSSEMVPLNTELIVSRMLLSLVQAPKLRNLLRDNVTATILTISPPSPLPNALQELGVGMHGKDQPFEISDKKEFGTRVSNLLKLLVLFPTVKRFYTDRRQFWEEHDASFNNLLPFWNPILGGLEPLDTYQGPISIARFLVAQQRIPKEIITFDGPCNLLLSSYEGRASIQGRFSGHFPLYPTSGVSSPPTNLGSLIEVLVLLPWENKKGVYGQVFAPLR
jgi:hypothetical protein